MKKISSLYIAFLLLACSPVVLHAQESTKSIVEQEQEQSLQQWNKSTNAAGLLLDMPSINSNITVGYQNGSGNFRRPQEANKNSAIGLSTQGNMQLKNYYLQGHFSYQRNSIKDAEYNASIIDPFRGMPYILADTNASDWLHQHYDLGFKLATPKVVDNISFGLQFNYNASSGAKQRDIRALNKYYALDLQPSVVYSINEKNHIGANFKYKNYKEESSNSNVNTYVDQGYFALFGLGNAINYIGRGRTTNYMGEALSAGLQYQYQGALRVFAAANYTVQAEDAMISFTNERPGGSTSLQRWDANLNLQHRGEKYIHMLDANMNISKTKGIEYITQFESGLDSDGYYTKYQSTRSKYNRNSAQVAYDISKVQGNVYNWKAGVFANYDKLVDEYLFPKSNMLAENITFGASANKLFQLSKANRSTFSIGLKVAFKNNLDGAYNYSGADASEITVTDFEQRNFEYYNANFTSFDLPLVYSQQLKTSSTLFVKGNATFVQTKDYNFDNRRAFSLSIGATF